MIRIGYEKNAVYSNRNIQPAQFGLYLEENAVNRSDWKGKPIEQISEIRTIQNGGGGINRVFIVYLPPQNRY